MPSLLVATLCWGTLFVVHKSMLEQSTILSYLFFVYTIYVVGSFIFYLLHSDFKTDKQKFRQIPISLYGKLAGYCLLGGWLYPLFTLWGLQTLPSGLDYFFSECSLSLLQFLLGIALLREKVTKSQFFFFLLAIVCVSMTGYTSFVHLPLKGTLFTLLGSLCYALYFVKSKPLMNHFSPLFTSLTFSFIGFLGFLFLYVGFDRSPLFSHPVSFWSGVCYTGIVYTFCYYLWQRGAQTLSIRHVSAAGMLIPLLGYVFSFCFLHEPFTFLMIICSFFTLLFTSYLFKD